MVCLQYKNFLKKHPTFFIGVPIFSDTEIMAVRGTITLILIILIIATTYALVKSFKFKKNTLPDNVPDHFEKKSTTFVYTSLNSSQEEPLLKENQQNKKIKSRYISIEQLEQHPATTQYHSLFAQIKNRNISMTNYIKIIKERLVRSDAKQSSVIFFEKLSYSPRSITPQKHKIPTQEHPARFHVSIDGIPDDIDTIS